MAFIENSLISLTVLVVSLLNRFHNMLLRAVDARLDYVFNLIKEYKLLKLNQIDDAELTALENAFVFLSEYNRMVATRKDVRRFYIDVTYASVWTHRHVLYEMEKNINIHHLFKEMFFPRASS